MTTIRRLGPGDDAVVARLATYPGPADRGIASAFVLTEPDNDAANALYRSVGGANEGTDVVWGFRYADG